MFKLVLALALGAAAAFQPAKVTVTRTQPVQITKDELIDLAESNTDALGATLGFWDPLGATNFDFFGLGEEGTIGYLRHAEIKHGAAPALSFSVYCDACEEQRLTRVGRSLQ